MVKVDVKYTGNLHCDATHGPSQSKISTDAPMDNKGKGEVFSPTDLVATALATCMSTTMGIKAQELGVDLRGMSVSVQKEMSKDPPRRIVGLPSEVHIPLPSDHRHREVRSATSPAFRSKTVCATTCSGCIPRNVLLSFRAQSRNL